MNPPKMPQNVTDVFARLPAPVKARLLAIRGLIFQLSDGMDSVGPLTETLRWGEPAYLTQTSKSGTTIRLGAHDRRHRMPPSSSIAKHRLSRNFACSLQINFTLKRTVLSSSFMTGHCPKTLSGSALPGH